MKTLKKTLKGKKHYLSILLALAMLFQSYSPAIIYAREVIGGEEENKADQLDFPVTVEESENDTAGEEDQDADPVQNEETESQINDEATNENESTSETEDEQLNEDELIVEEEKEDDSAEQTWMANEDGSYTTTQPVQEGVEYVYPADSTISITFSALSQSGTVTMRKVYLSDEQMSNLSSIYPWAIEITSTMDNGSFEYSLQLPKPVSEDSVKVAYSENWSEFTQVDSETVGDAILTELDHFTVFMVVDEAGSNQSDRAINFVYPIDGDVLDSSESINIQIEAYFDSSVDIVDRIAIRYTDVSNTCDTAFTNPFEPLLVRYDKTFGNYPEGLYVTRDDDVYTFHDVDISGIASGNYKLCALMHGEKAENRGNIADHRAEVSIMLAGNVNFMSYECPASIGDMLSDGSTKNEFKPDNSGDVTADLTALGCHLVDGYEIGHLGKGIVTPVPTGGESADTIGTTGVSGIGLLRTSLEVGDYMLGEVSGGTWVNDGDVLGFACNNSNVNGHRDNNAEKVTVSSTEDVYCNLYKEDTTAPVVTITNPAEGDYINGTADLRVTIEEDIELLRYYYRITDSLGNVIIAQTVNRSTSMVDETFYTWNTNDVNDGVYSIHVAARDAAMNRDANSEDTIVVTVDNTAPSKPTWIGILDYEGNNLGCAGYTNNRNITVDWNDNPESDIAYYEYDVKDRNNIVQPVNSQFSGRIRDLDGYYQYRVRAVDNAGNISESSDWCGVNLDRVAPVTPAGLERRALDGTIYQCGDITQLQTLIPDWDDNTEEDFSHYEYTSFHPDGSIGLNRRELNDSEMVHSWVPTVEGTYGYAVRAVDNAGNVSEWALTGETLGESCQITYDSTPPSVPENLTFTSTDGTVDFGCGNYTNEYSIITQWDDSTDDSGISHYEYQSFNPPTGWVWGPINVTASQRPGNFTVGQGLYGFAVRAVDNAGNKSEWTAEEFKESCQIGYDIEAPDTPTNIEFVDVYGDVLSCGAYTNSHEITVNWDDVTDNPIDRDNSGLYKYVYKVVYVNPDTGVETVWNTDRFDSTFSGTFNNREGLRRISVMSVDNAGNESKWGDECTIYYDNTAPVISNLPDMDLFEGDVIDLSFLSDFEVSDDIGLNELYIGVSYTDLEENVFSGDVLFDISGLGTGGTLSEIDFSTLGNFYADSSIIDEGTYVITYYVTDLAGNQSNTQVVTITLRNVAPIVSLASNQTVNEGEEAVFTGSFADPSFISDEDWGQWNADDSPWTYTVDYGNGQTQTGVMTEPGTIEINPMTYTTDEDEYTYTVSLIVCEATIDENPYRENECTTATVLVTVLNVAPSVNITATPSQTTTLPTTITLTASVTGGNLPYQTAEWSGDCSGTADSVTITEAGTYTCTYTVTDVDGDTDSDIVTVTISPEPAAEPETTPEATTATPAPTGTGTVLAAQQTAEETEEEEEDEDTTTEEEENDEGDVLGAVSCDVKTTVSGQVFIDKDGNGEKDDGEKGVSGVNLTIYFERDGERVEVAEVTTDEDGNWEAEICPGSYKVELDTDSLPRNVTLAGEDVKGVRVELDEENSINFALESNASFLARYWWVILLALALILTTAVVIKKRSEQ